MTKVTYIRTTGGRIDAFRSVGHSLFSPENDIVCAAISALSVATINGITDVVGVHIRKKHLIVSDGLIQVHIPIIKDKMKEKQVQVLLETMILALENIEADNEGFVSVKEIRR